MRSASILAVGAALAILFFWRFRLATVLLAESLPPMFAAVAVLLASFATGHLALVAATRPFGRSEERPSPLDALLVGFPTLGSLIAIVAWIGLFLDAMVMMLTIALAVIGAVLLARRRPSFEAPPASFLLLLLPPAAVALAMALLPVSSPDEMIYKLAVPHAYQLYGRMLELPLNSNASFTLATHMVDLAALILHGGIAAKLARVGIWLATLAVLRRAAGNWLAVVFAWTPTLMLLAGWAWDEWIVIGLLVLSFERFERWLDGHSPLDATIAFAAAGAAAASKYTALPWLAAFAVIAMIRARRQPRTLILGALLIASFGGLFYVRNLLWTGSPVAPFFEKATTFGVNYRSAERFSGWKDFACGMDVFDPSLADEALGIALPAVALASLLALSRNRRTIDLLLLGAIQLPILLTMAPGSRNVVTGFVPFAILGAEVVANAWRSGGRAFRVAFGGLATVVLGGQLVLVTFVVSSFEPLAYLSGAESGAQYLARMHAFVKPYAFLHATTQPDARVLLLGESDAFHLQRQAIWGGNFDGPRIAAWLSRFRNAEELAVGLRELGVTHILIRRSQYRVGQPPPESSVQREIVLDVPVETDRVLRAFLATRARLLYREGDYLIYGP